MIDNAVANAHVIYNVTTGAKYPMRSNKKATKKQTDALNRKPKTLSKAEFLEQACNELIPFLFLRIKKSWRDHHSRQKTYARSSRKKRRWINAQKLQWKFAKPITNPDKFKLTRRSKWINHYDKFHKEWYPRSRSSTR